MFRQFDIFCNVLPEQSKSSTFPVAISFNVDLGRSLILDRRQTVNPFSANKSLKVIQILYRQTDLFSSGVMMRLYQILSWNIEEVSDFCFGRQRDDWLFTCIREFTQKGHLGNQGHFKKTIACRNLNIRDKEKYCHKITLYKNPMYQYSLSAIEFISSEFINNKSVFEECKSRTNKQKNR